LIQSDFFYSCLTSTRSQGAVEQQQDCFFIEQIATQLPLEKGEITFPLTESMSGIILRQ
jgi:hypothetical protein